MKQMNGAVVFITGGASGLGLEAARQLAERGAHVVNFSRDRNAAEAAVRSIEAARRSPEQRVGSYQLDVAEREQVLAVFAMATTEYGHPDIVINMAGVDCAGTMAEMPFAAFDRVMKINIYGTRNVVEATLASMLPRGRGRIVLVGSMAGFVPVYGYTAYGTSKFAVVGYAQCLRYELKPRGITVSCYCPGEVETPALAHERTTSHPATKAIKQIGGTLPVEPAVAALVDGILKDRFLIVPGLRMKLIHWAFRLTPLRVWNAVTDVIIAFSLRKAGQS